MIIVIICLFVIAPLLLLVPLLLFVVIATNLFDFCLAIVCCICHSLYLPLLTIVICHSCHCLFAMMDLIDCCHCHSTHNHSDGTNWDTKQENNEPLMVAKPQSTSISLKGAKQSTLTVASAASPTVANNNKNEYHHFGTSKKAATTINQCWHKKEQKTINLGMGTRGKQKQQSPSCHQR